LHTGHLIYSEGTLTADTDQTTGWFSPSLIDKTKPNWNQCFTTDDMRRFAKFKMWSAGGFSGSVIINAKYHRDVTGPGSTYDNTEGYGQHATDRRLHDAGGRLHAGARRLRTAVAGSTTK
jgi:hypothetical protein